MSCLKIRKSVGLLLAAVLLSACNNQNNWDSPSANAQVAEANAPTATRQPAKPAVAATSAPTTNSTSLIITPTPMPESYWDKFPKDEKGRVIGGKASPVLNYSPTMVTGKPCPRIKKWGYKVMLDEPVPPLQAVAAPDNRCVIQNAIDDYVRTLFTQGSATTQKDAEAVVKLFETDPALIKGIDKEQLQTQINAYRKGLGPYVVCSKQIYRLIDYTHKAPLISNNDGSVAPNILEIRLMHIAADLQPYECEWRKIADNSALSKEVVSAKDIQAGGTLPVGVYTRVWVRYNPKTNSWQDFTFGRSMNSTGFLTVASQLLAESPLKP